MPLWLNITLTLFYVLWLYAVLVLLSLIWRNGSKRAQRMDKTRVDAAMKAAEAAQTASQAALIASEAVHMLASHYEEGQTIP